jgi:hypothetical protein
VHFIVPANTHGGVVEEDGAENVAQQNGGSKAQITGPRESGSPESAKKRQRKPKASEGSANSWPFIQISNRTKPRHQKTFFVFQKRCRCNNLKVKKINASGQLPVQGTSWYGIGQKTQLKSGTQAVS